MDKIFALFFILFSTDASVMWKMKDYEKYQFSAYVDEVNGRSVVFPAVRLHLTEGSKICNFTMTSGDARTMDDTFFVGISNDVSGGGHLKIFNHTDPNVLRQKDGVQMFVQAKDCGIHPETSPKRPIVIYVVKREQPRWLDAIVHIPVLQPLAAGTTLIQLTALPPENSSKASTQATNETTADMAGMTEGICNYTLSSAPNLHYSMDSNGFLTTTKDIPHITGRTHFLSVQASTCSDPPVTSVPAIVLITFCSPYWSELPQILRYQSFSHGLYVFENATFENCSLQPESWDTDSSGRPAKRTEPPVGCKPDRTVALVELSPAKKSSTLECMVDPEAMRTKLSTCGIFVRNASWHNLLPTVIRYEDAVGRNNWPRLLTDIDGGEKHEDDGHFPVNSYFSFDGTQHLNLTALRVLRDISKGYLTQFSLLFWVHPRNLTSKNSLLYSSLPIGENVDGFSVAMDKDHVEVVLRAVQDTETATYKEIVLVYVASVSPETWQHIAVVYTAEDNMASAEPNVKVFLNGRQLPRQYPTEWKVATAVGGPLGQHLIVGASWSAEERTFSGFLKGDLAGLTLLRETILDSVQLQCFIDCHARFSLDSGAFRGISPDTRVTWETPFNSILIDSFDSQQVVLLLRRLRVLNLEWRLARKESQTALRLTGFITCEDSDEILHTKPTIIYVTGAHSTAVKGFAEDHADTLPFFAVHSEDSRSTRHHVDRIETGEDAAAVIGVTEDEAEEAEPDLSDSQPCAYRLRLHSALVDSQAGKTLQVTGLGVGDGQLLVPDMEIYWEANSARCQEMLEEHEINVLSCSIGTCLSSDSGLRLDSEQLSLHGFDQTSLQRLNISTELDSEGLSISGKGSLETYAQLLRNLGWSYSRRQPGADVSRCFLMQCTATIQDNMNRVIAFHRSNQITVKLALADSPSSPDALEHRTNTTTTVSSPPRSSFLRGAQFNRKNKPGHWAALIILLMAFASVIIGFVWVRVQSRKRRSPAYSHKVLLRSFVAANPHCGFDEEAWQRGDGSSQPPTPGTSRSSPPRPRPSKSQAKSVEDEEDEGEADENVWIPVRREASPSIETLKDENLLKLATVVDRPGRQVHFILNPLLAVSKKLHAGSEWTSDEGEDDESENGDFGPGEISRSVGGVSSTAASVRMDPALLDTDQVPLISAPSTPAPAHPGFLLTAEAEDHTNTTDDNFVSSTTRVLPMTGSSRAARAGDWPVDATP